MERTRCGSCRNPIKAHQLASGPSPADRSFHLDCWLTARAAALEEAAQRQRAYEELIVEQGLVGLLSPYVCVFPAPHEAGPVRPATHALV